MRAKIVLMAAQGLENKTIAGRLDLPFQIVSKWRKRFYEERLPGLAERSRTGRSPVFPPKLVVAVKAIACELPARLGLPFSRLHVPDIQAEVIRRGLAASISEKMTIWRWLDEDAIKPWTHRSWIFPRDPDFEAKAARVLDLYAREFEGRQLKPNEFVISADEKTSIQARVRCHPTVAANSRHPMLVEHEYERAGSLAYIAAWDVHRAKLFGRLELSTGIAPFGRLVEQVLTQEPYRSARRVFWVLDNGSSPDPNPSAHPCQLAQPNRDLLLDPAAQSPHSARRDFACRARRTHTRLPGHLRNDGATVRVEVHARRSGQAPRTPCQKRAGAAGRSCMNTSPKFRATALSQTPIRR